MDFLSFLKNRGQGGREGNDEEMYLTQSPYLTENARNIILRALSARKNEDMYPPQRGIEELLSLLRQGKGRA